jgi:hypothetical protein
MQKVQSIEQKDDKNGVPMKVTMFDNGDRVYVSSKYDEAIYEKVEVGAEFELYKDGTFNKIKYDKPAPANRGGAGVAKMMEKKEASIEKFQQSKESSIEKMSVFRDSTLLTVAWANKQPEIDTKDIQDKWVEFRSWLQKKMGEELPF